MLNSQKLFFCPIVNTGIPLFQPPPDCPPSTGAHCKPVQAAVPRVRWNRRHEHVCGSPWLGVTCLVQILAMQILKSEAQGWLWVLQTPSTFQNHLQQTLSFAPTVFSPHHSPLFAFSHQACWDHCCCITLPVFGSALLMRFSYQTSLTCFFHLIPLTEYSFNFPPEAGEGSSHVALCGGHSHCYQVPLKIL